MTSKRKDKHFRIYMHVQYTCIPVLSVGHSFTAGISSTWKLYSSAGSLSCLNNSNRPDYCRGPSCTEFAYHKWDRTCWGMTAGLSNPSDCSHSNMASLYSPSDTVLQKAFQIPQNFISHQPEASPASTTAIGQTTAVAHHVLSLPTISETELVEEWLPHWATLQTVSTQTWHPCTLRRTQFYSRHLRFLKTSLAISWKPLLPRQQQ